MTPTLEPRLGQPGCGSGSLIRAPPAHLRPSCARRVLHQQLLHRGGRRQLLEAAGAAPGRERDPAERHARGRAPVPAPGQPHRDLSGPARPALRGAEPHAHRIWLDGLVWLLLEGLGQTRRQNSRGSPDIFFPVGGVRWVRAQAVEVQGPSSPSQDRGGGRGRNSPQSQRQEISLPLASSRGPGVMNSHSCLGTRFIRYFPNNPRL